jgi:Raf kinase inhibitor-like YbhB/YbcL family protein
MSCSAHTDRQPEKKGEVMDKNGLKVALSMLCIVCSYALYAGCSKNDEASTAPATATTGFVLESTEVSEGGTLPSDYTCDGTSSTLPMTWSGAPADTRSYAIIMHHEASPSDIHWYWVLYNIPAEVNSLPRNVAGVGTLGNNSVNGRLEYAPPCSQGPGPKTYTYTIYALSSSPAIAVPDSLVNRAVLLESMEGLILDTAVLNVVYSRQESSRPGGINR